MATGKYTRIDGRNSSSGCCSTVTLVAFVALCLVGVWMMTSSSVVPVQNSDVSSQENKNALKTQVSESNESNSGSESSNTNIETNTSEEGNSKQFEDNPGDLPEDATKGDSNVSSATRVETDSNSQEKSKAPDKTNEENQEEKPEEKAGKQSEEKEAKSEDASKSDTESGEEKKQDGESNESKSGDESGDVKKDGDDSESGKKEDSKEGYNESKSDSVDGEKKSDENLGEATDKGTKSEETTGDQKDPSLNELLPSGAQSELLNETLTQNGSFSTQAAESKKEKETESSEPNEQINYSWKLCNSTAGPDYIPCLDNLQAIRKLRTTKHYEHRERHCPEDPPTCLVPLPEGYQQPIEWPTSREKIWYHNVPHTKLAEVKGHQNWVKVTGEFLTFPGGGTQFKHGALHYIDFIQLIVPDIAWGKQSRVVLDVGCGVASFGGFLFDRDVLTMSFAPKDEHEAQVQFALERGIPAISAVMGTKRLPYPARVFDVVHCARCRVPWHIEGGKLLLELNRLLRPGGFFLWSATPVYQKLPEDVEIWEAMKKLTKQMCWELITTNKDKVNKVGVAVYQKPTSNECYEQRSENEPALCKESDDPDAAWNVPLQTCMHKIPAVPAERGSKWPEQWPTRLEKPPYWLLESQVGVYGKAAPRDFIEDYEHWKRVVTKSYLKGMGINWSNVRNVMDMKAVYGGFAAALRDLNVWVMNIVSIDSPDTLPIIYERGLFGMYHDWCESLSTYPRSYDLLHADHLFSKTKKKCNLTALVVDVDRILRPEGKLIVRDKVEIISELESMFKSLRWDIRMTYAKDKEGLLCVQKTTWRPNEFETLTYAIA